MLLAAPEGELPQMLEIVRHTCSHCSDYQAQYLTTFHALAATSLFLCIYPSSCERLTALGAATAPGFCSASRPLHPSPIGAV